MNPPAPPLWRVRDRATWDVLRRTQMRARSGRVTVARAGGANDSSPAQLAFAVGRKVGTAVTRNRIRRQLREMLRAARLPGGAAYLVTVRAGDTDVRADLQGALERLAAKGFAA